MDAQLIPHATFRTVGRKLPNKLRNPNPSTKIPTSPHLIITSATPKKKHTVPRNFLVNNVIDLDKPMANTNPNRNNALPIEISAESKNITTPSMRKKIPKQISPSFKW